LFRVKELFKELCEGIIHPVYVFLGEDGGTKEEFLRSIIDRLFSDKRQEEQVLSTAVFYGDDTEVESVVENANTYSFLSDKRVIVVHDFDKMSNLNVLSEYMNTPNSSTVLVLLSKNKSVPKKFDESASRHGRVSIFWPMFRNEGEQWFYSRLKEMRIKAEKDAVDYIFDVSGTGRDELNVQLQFLVSYLSEGEVLTLEKAQDAVARLNTYTVFDLCNALFVKNSGEILSIFHHLLDYGEDLGRIVYFCAREILKLYDCFVMKESGFSFASIKKKLSLRKMEADRIGSIITRMNRRYFGRLFSKLTGLDFTLKTNPRETARGALEVFLAGLGKKNVSSGTTV